MEQSFIINADSIKAIREKLADPDNIKNVIATIKKIIEIKKALLWRADTDTCCGSLCNIAASLTREINMLENALNSIEDEKKSDAVQTLKEYEQLLKSKN